MGTSRGVGVQHRYLVGSLSLGLVCLVDGLLLGKISGLFFVGFAMEDLAQVDLQLLGGVGGYPDVVYVLSAIVSFYDTIEILPH